MDRSRLSNQCRRNQNQSLMSRSLGLLNFRGLFDEHREENYLKWLTFSSNPVSLLPVFLASAELTESETLRRASCIGVMTPKELHWSMESAMLPRALRYLTGPGVMPKKRQATDPFRATALWENIIYHLENNIKSGRHSSRFRVYDNCFRGTQAVVCLSTYLNTVLPKTVSREQVLILCQKLIITGVMEDVKDEERTMFKEGRLYSFSKEHFWHHPAAEVDSHLCPALSRCIHTPAQQNTPRTEERQVQEHDMSQMLLGSSIKYPSDSTLVALNHIRHVDHLPRQTSHKQFSACEFKQHGVVGHKLKKASTIMCTHADDIRSDAPKSPKCNNRRAKLSRRNAMRREIRPLCLIQSKHQQTTPTDEGDKAYRVVGLSALRSQSQSCMYKDEGNGIYRPRMVGPVAQRSQSQSYQNEGDDVYRVHVVGSAAQRARSHSYKVKHAVSCRTSTDRTYMDRKHEKEPNCNNSINTHSNKFKHSDYIVKENGDTVKSYCIDITNLGHVNKLKLFTTQINPVSSVKEDVPAAMPPTGMNWVVYGYL